MKWAIAFGVAAATQFSLDRPGPPAGEMAPRPKAAVAVDQTGSYDGEVVSVTADAITVRAAGEQPKTFPLSAALRRGGSPLWRESYYRYRVTDIRLGDRVRVDFYRYGTVYECVGVGIMRRPGGRIPPEPDQNPRALFQHHEQQQAYQDYEEKGTPFPEKYCPPWARPAVAPMPREKGPPAIPPSAP